jgi:hypothetical protein
MSYGYTEELAKIRAYGNKELVWIILINLM